VRRLSPKECTPICLDNEFPKLGIDFVTCSHVSPHLTSDQFEAVLRECARAWPKILYMVQFPFILQSNIEA
jgi:hypothetical protein